MIPIVRIYYDFCSHLNKLIIYNIAIIVIYLFYGLSTIIGAGKGIRTLTTSLEGWDATVEHHTCIFFIIMCNALAGHILYDYSACTTGRVSLHPS